MNITVYQFVKRENSTKIPATTTTKATITAVLKENCSIINPVFQISKDYAYYNYISAFNRYYWVTNVTYLSNDIVELSCKVDVLASFKTEIGSSTQYVLRSASDSDGTIIDSLYPVKRSVYRQMTSPSEPQAFTLTQGFYIVNYLSNSGPKTYMTTDAYLGETLQAMKKVARWKPETNPLSRLISVNYCPIRQDEFGTLIPYEGWDIFDSDTIEGADYVVYYEGWQIPSNIFTISESFTVNKHPQASSRGAYLNGSPYSKYYLHAGPFGTIELPGEILGTSIKCDIEYDFKTGKSCMRIYNGSVSVASALITTVNAIMGIPIQVSQATNGVNLVNSAKVVGSVVGSVVGAAAAAYTGNLVAAGAAAASGLNAITSFQQMQTQRMLSAGSNGSMTDALGLTNEFFALQEEFYAVADEFNADFGRPLCKVKILNTLSGYIKCENAEFKALATQEELSAVTAYMNSGFFYE